MDKAAADIQVTGEHAGSEILIVRVEGWRFAVPLGSVKWVHDSAMPVLRPGRDGARAYFAMQHQPPMPLVFAARLFGSTHVTLRATDKVLELETPASPGGGLALWITGVDDVCAGAATTHPSNDHSAFFVEAKDGVVAVLEIDRLAAAVRACFAEGAQEEDPDHQ